MPDERESTESALANKRIDYLVTTLKGVVGTVPFGGLVAEAVGATIPQQRVDRIADVLKRVATKVDDIQLAVETMNARFHSPEFTDVLEEALVQAGRAMSDERREHLANILANGLSEPELNHGRLKKLLSLLQDLADEEIIILTYSNLANRPNKTAFFNRHENVLRDVAITHGASREIREAKGLQEAWRRRLVQLGLANNERSGVNDITSLGRMFLRYIGAPRDWDLENDNAWRDWQVE